MCSAQDAQSFTRLARKRDKLGQEGPRLRLPGPLYKTYMEEDTKIVEDTTPMHFWQLPTAL